MGHIPWVSRYMNIIPGAVALKRLRAFSMQKFSIRKNEGSGKKDLFYHLVKNSNPCHLVAFSLLLTYSFLG